MKAKIVGASRSRNGLLFPEINFESNKPEVATLIRWFFAGSKLLYFTIMRLLDLSNPKVPKFA